MADLECGSPWGVSSTGKGRDSAVTRAVEESRRMVDEAIYHTMKRWAFRRGREGSRQVAGRGHGSAGLRLIFTTGPSVSTPQETLHVQIHFPGFSGKSWKDPYSASNSSCSMWRSTVTSPGLSAAVLAVLGAGGFSLGGETQPLGSRRRGSWETGAWAGLAKTRIPCWIKSTHHSGLSS